MDLQTTSTFLKLRSNPKAEIRLFCFPNAGGGAALLHSWFNGLPESIQLCPIYLPGRESRRQEPPFVRIGALVEAVADALSPLLDFPFALFGHSAGAIMAFETARELVRRGRPSPLRLIVSAHTAPHIRGVREPIHHLPDTEFLAQLVKRYDAIPSSVLADRELMAMFLPILKADMQMLDCYEYRPGPPLDCPITALGGVLDSTVSSSQLEAWQQQTNSSFRLQLFPGGHFFLKESRPQVVKAISSDLLM